MTRSSDVSGPAVLGAVVDILKAPLAAQLNAAADGRILKMNESAAALIKIIIDGGDSPRPPIVQAGPDAG